MGSRARPNRPPNEFATRARLSDAWRVLRTDRLLRSAGVASLVGGVANSITAPQLSLFLTTELGASLRQAGWFYLTNLSAPIAGLLIGSWSDRTRRVWLGYALSGALTAVGWFVIAGSTHLWIPFAASTLLLAFGGAVSGQLFAAVRHHLRRLEAEQRARSISADTSTQVMALIRMAMTAGWIIGPVLGSWLGGQAGLRWVMVASGLGVLVQVIVGLAGRRARSSNLGPGPASQAPASGVSAPGMAAGRRVPLLAMAVFTTWCVITLAGNTMKYAYLPIYLVDHFHTSDAVRGAVIGSQQVVELALMPVAAVLGSRFGGMRVVAAGAVAAMLAHLCFALGSTLPWMFVGQVLLGVMWSAIAALGLPIAMELAGPRIGVASGLFMSSGPVASAVGGLVGGLAVSRLGLPGVFWVPVGLSAVAAAGIVMLDDRRRRSLGSRVSAR